MFSLIFFKKDSQHAIETLLDLSLKLTLTCAHFMWDLIMPGQERTEDQSVNANRMLA